MMPGVTGWCGYDVRVFRVGSECYTEHGMCLTEGEMHEGAMYISIQSSHRAKKRGRSRAVHLVCQSC